MESIQDFRRLLNFHGRPAAGGPSRLWRTGVILTLAFVFLRVSFLHELLVYEFGSNFLVLYVVAVPLAIALVLAGSFRWLLRARTVLYWAGFVIWMAICISFSSSTPEPPHTLLGYLKGGVIVIPFTAGFGVSWRECRQICLAVAAAGCLNLFSVIFYGSAGDGRMELAFGTIGGPNNLAAHLVFLLPFFVLIVALESYSWVVRVAAFLASVFAAYVLLSTGSRGGLTASIATVLVLLLSRSKKLRIVTLGVVIATSLTILVYPIPARASEYLATLWSRKAAASNEPAIASLNQRIYILHQSFLITLHNPIVGVGPGQFPKALSDDRGLEMEAHNTYTQISSETGFPGVILFIAAIASACSILVGASFGDKGRVGGGAPQLAAYCVLASFIGYGTAALFLSHGYHVLFPLLTGISVCLFSATDKRLPGTDR